MINSTELEKYAKDYLEKLFGNATLIQGISAQHFLEPTDNGYVTKRYSSFIINESTSTEVEENSKENKGWLLVDLLLGKIPVLVYWYGFGNM